MSVPGGTEAVIIAHGPSTHAVPAGTKGFAGEDQANKQETHIPSPRPHPKATYQAHSGLDRIPRLWEMNYHTVTEHKSIQDTLVILLVFILGFLT